MLLLLLLLVIIELLLFSKSTGGGNYYSELFSNSDGLFILFVAGAVTSLLMFKDDISS